MPSVNAALTLREVRIPVDDIWLYGDLVTPPGFQGLVLFAHGSGSGRHSARNRQVAQHLQQVGIATLLTAQEEQTDLNTREHRFDISLLTRRMQDATAWAAAQPELQHAAIGYFGASTGSAATPCRTCKRPWLKRSSSRRVIRSPGRASSNFWSGQPPK